MTVFVLTFVSQHGHLTTEVFTSRELAQNWANTYTNLNYYITEKPIHESVYSRNSSDLLKTQ